VKVLELCTSCTQLVSPCLTRLRMLLTPPACLQTHPFCSRCGKETIPTEGGSRRRCIGRQPHKLYPRTDPVVGPLAQRHCVLLQQLCC
jgi:NADH pyrophosphatase NudC (nudix superfamily)